MFRRRGHLVERAVDAIANFKLIFERFKVNVAGSILNCLKEHQVYKPHDRHFVGQIGHLGHILRGGRFGCFLGQSGIGAQLRQNVPYTFIVFAIVFAVKLLDRPGLGHHHLNFLADGESQFIDCRGIQRIAQCHLHD